VGRLGGASWGERGRQVASRPRSGDKCLQWSLGLFVSKLGKRGGRSGREHRTELAKKRSSGGKPMCQAIRRVKKRGKEPEEKVFEKLGLRRRTAVATTPKKSRRRWEGGGYDTRLGGNGASHGKLGRPSMNTLGLSGELTTLEKEIHSGLSPCEEKKGRRLDRRRTLRRGRSRSSQKAKQKQTGGKSLTSMV